MRLKDIDILFCYFIEFLIIIPAVILILLFINWLFWGRKKND
jgi:hypothetical protein